MIGWVSIHRSLCNHSIWLAEPFTKGQAWVDLILLANHEEGYIRKRGIKIIVKRGQVGWSQRSLADRWKWSRGKVERFLKDLMIDDQIEPQNGPQKNNITSLITIKNYDQYQEDVPQTGHKRAANGPQTGRKRGQNNNDNNDNNNKKKINKRKIASYLPENYILDEKHLNYAIEKSIPENKINDIFEHFCIYHRKKGNKYLSWYAAWQTWVRNHIEYQKKSNTKKHKIMTEEEIERMQNHVA